MKNPLSSRARRACFGVALAAAATSGAISASAANPHANYARFSLFPNASVQNCVAAPGKTPIATVTVQRGSLNDTLDLHVRNLKPNLDFDVFTIEKTPQLSDGSANPAFDGKFGMAWYQSDLETDRHGEGDVKIKTILLDQIFGFDASTGLAPVNTFNVGFWFNNPGDAASCGFTGSTPFNGEHNAGPVAMISRTDATTHLGPLCTAPESNGDGTFHCNP
jgi:hypothetical protein